MKGDLSKWELYAAAKWAEDGIVGLCQGPGTVCFCCQAMHPEGGDSMTEAAELEYFGHP